MKHRLFLKAAVVCALGTVVLTTSPRRAEAGGQCAYCVTYCPDPIPSHYCDGSNPSCPGQAYCQGYGYPCQAYGLAIVCGAAC